MLKIYTNNYPQGVELLTPSKFKVTTSDFDSDKTTRNVRGYMVRDRIRARLKSLEIEWRGLSRAEMATLMNHFNSNAAFTTSDGLAVPKFFIALEYPDPSTTGNLRKIFYVSDRNSPLYNDNLGRWESLSFTLVER